MATDFSWLLCDDRPGNRTQVLGVAEAMDIPFTEIPLTYSPLIRIPNRLMGARLAGITADSQQRLLPPWPSLVIAAGRRTAPVARWIKKQSPTTLLCHLMRPDMNFSGFDLVVVPRHDEPPRLPNVMTTLGAPHRVTFLMLEQAALGADALFPGLPRPFWGVLVGGDCKHGAFTAEDASRLGETLAALLQKNGGSALVTTSRRTSLSAQTALQQSLLPIPHFFWPWQAQGMNPYIPILGAADALVITQDSVAMLSEATATGRPLYLFPTFKPNPFSSFHQTLENEGYLKKLPSLEKAAHFEHTPWAYSPVCIAKDVAISLQRLLERQKIN
jgi:uncharacterized protein